ncbi:MAG: hypothetical protein Q4C70_02490 [Planctomycetia bacterium]|nr:hypothetical protein [Planctomycetia bacterium]
MKEFPIRLENGTATQQDLIFCQNLWNLASSEVEKRPFLLLIAQYQRKVAQNPALCIEMLLPTVGVYVSNLPVSKSKSPKKQKQSLKVPPLEDWTIDSGNALCAIEIANCLLDDGQIEIALQIIDEVGQKFSDESRVLAAETGGDLYQQMKIYDRSVEFYTFALKVLETLKKTEYELGKGERKIFSEEQMFLKNRIEDKRRKAQKFFEADRYGPDWVAYRDAQEMDFAEDFLTAYWLYGKVIEKYPESIYAEASRCYRIVLLTKFADIDNFKNFSEVIKTKQEKLPELRQKLFFAQKSKREEDIQKYQAEIENITSFLTLATTLPTGIKAIEQAEIEAEKFIVADETGLYRGEVMLEIGLCYLTVFFEIDVGEEWLNRTQNWLKKIQDTTEMLNTFPIPTLSADISKPPEKTFHRDMWGNLLDIEPKAGDLVNRQTCKWYINHLMANTQVFLGFLDFVRDDISSAMEHFELMKVCDIKISESLQKKESNMYDRLSDYCKKGHLRRATKEDLKSFKARQRFIILLADFYATIEVFDKAWKITENFLKGKYGKYNKNQEAYLRFACAWALWADSVVSNRNEHRKYAQEILCKFLTDKNLQIQPIASRALFSCANVFRYTNNPENMRKAISIFHFIEKNYPKSEQYDQAIYARCTELYFLGNEAEKLLAIHDLEKFLENKPNGPYADVVKQRLEKWRNKK